MARYHFGYHDWPLTGEDCLVCQERCDGRGEEEAIDAAEQAAEQAHEDGIRDRRDSRDDGVLWPGAGRP